MREADRKRDFRRVPGLILEVVGGRSVSHGLISRFRCGRLSSKGERSAAEGVEVGVELLDLDVDLDLDLVDESGVGEVPGCSERHGVAEGVLDGQD